MAQHISANFDISVDALGAFPTTPPTNAIPIKSGFDIKGPGVYSLQNDIPNLVLSSYSDVILFGNNHVVSGFVYVGDSVNYSLTGIVVRDLTVANIQVNGNTSATRTALAARLINITTMLEADSPNNFYGSNTSLEQCSFAGKINLTDDNVVLWNPIGRNDYAYWVTFDTCKFAGNYDLGLEGIGSWSHVTVRNCDLAWGNGGVGGWYGPHYADGNHSYSFALDHCIFTNNAVKGFVFAAPGGLLRVGNDADANAAWGQQGNVFAGNTYY